MAAIHILLIDDNEEHCKNLRIQAYNFGKKKGKEVLIEYFTESVEGFKELENESKYKALILDAKGIIKKGEADDYEFLPNALRKLGEINLSKNRIYTPFAVYTGNSNQSEVKLFTREIEDTRGKIFAKPTQAEEMLQYLLDEIERHPVTKIERSYPDIFEIFEIEWSDSSFRGDLLELLKNCNSGSQTDIRQNLALLRSLQERMFQTLSKKDNKLIPEFMVNPNVSFWKVHNHLSGNIKDINFEKRNRERDSFKKKEIPKDFQPTTEVFQNNWIENLSKCIYEITSDNGVHTPYEITPLPNKYTVQSLTFAFLEQLLWFKKLMS